jgi:uncharacterized BrkB/YihY/UPF0761 family membrane protein
MGSDATDRDPAPHRGRDDDESAAVVSRLDRWRERGMDALEDATERVPVIGSIVAAGERERERGGGLLAGGVAYRLFFWIVPAGLAAAAASSLAGTLPKGGIEQTAGSRGLGAAVAAAERESMDANSSARWYLLVLGVALAVWFGKAVVRAIAVVHAVAWEQKVPKVRRPLVAGAVFTVVTSLLTLAAAAATAVLSGIGLGPLALALSLVLVYGGVALFISMFFPHADAPPRALLPGCLLISAGAVGLHVFVNVYLAPKMGRSVSTYGMLGAATVILLWLYIIARLITVAAFLNASLWRDRNPRAHDAARSAAVPSAPTEGAH